MNPGFRREDESLNDIAESGGSLAPLGRMPFWSVTGMMVREITFQSLLMPKGMAGWILVLHLVPGAPSGAVAGTNAEVEVRLDWQVDEVGDRV